ncbi:MAG: cytochrome c1 [Legionellales bacterium]|nr:cytochrome c1 [Legionellales bacterium]
MSKLWVIGVACFFFIQVASAASNGLARLQSVTVDVTDKAALQRGAKWYMNYCAGCHSLEYLRYSRLGQDIGITDYKGDLNTEILTRNLIFTAVKFTEPIQIALQAEQARQWFGVMPPDLTLRARVRGADWLYTYLTSFYQDSNRPFGANNRLFPDTAMPNVFYPLQGKQIAMSTTREVMVDGELIQQSVIEDLQLIRAGSMTEHEFRSMVTDLVTFLVYVSEPGRLQRQQLGWKVLIFLIIFAVFAYLLKRSYWKKLLR